MTNAPALDLAPSTLLEASIRETVQDIPNAAKDNGVVPLYFPAYRGGLLPPVGSAARDKVLDDVYHDDRNGALQGVISGVSATFAATPYEFKGEDEREVKRWQQILFNAQWGAGANEFLRMWATDYLRRDRGVYVELTAPGDPQYAPTGRVSGISILDSLRCRATGDPRSPVVYQSLKGDYHLLPAARVLHSVDMPESNERLRGVGKCALSRAVAIAQREVMMSRYISANLDDLPPPGVNIWSNVNSERLKEAVSASMMEQSTDGGGTWGRSINVHGMDMSRPVDMKSISFSTPPDKFDWQLYTELDIKLFALAFNIDVQDLWPYTGGPIGTAGQSQVQHEKGRGRMMANLYTTFERRMNDMLPDGLEFSFKQRDIRADEAEAKNASTWVTTVNSATDLQPDEKRRILANKVEAFADVLLDPNGNIIKLDDLDPKPLSIGTDSTTLDIGASTALNLGGAAQPLQIGAGTANQPLMLGTGKKDFEATRSEFVDNLVDLIGTGNDGEMGRRRFGLVFRAQLRRLGQKAFADGMAQGGVTDPLDDDELAQVQVWLANQSSYVTDFANTVYGKGYTRAEIASHAEMWANKSLREAFDMGRMAADRNGMYEWIVGATEHCEDCLRLSNQVHRFKQWYVRDWLPGSRKLFCQGYRCACMLTRTTQPAKGRF